MNESHTAEQRILNFSLGSGIIVVLIEAYMDESGTGDNDLVHCLAGYLMRPDRSVEMADAWKIVLNRYGIPFFHMTDCAAYMHCEPYKSLGRDKCIELATALIVLIKQHCLQGFAVCFSPKYYSTYKDDNIKSQNPYAFSVGVAHTHLQASLREIGYEGEVSYIFESGHRHQKQARAVLDRLHDDAESTGKVFSSSFQPKASATLLQAADIIAWHCQTYIKRKTQGRNMRADFISLLEIPHSIFHFANPFKDGLKVPETTMIVLDRIRIDEAASVDGIIKAIYLFDKPIPA